MLPIHLLLLAVSLVPLCLTQQQNSLANQLNAAARSRARNLRARARANTVRNLAGTSRTLPRQPQSLRPLYQHHHHQIRSADPFHPVDVPTVEPSDENVAFFGSRFGGDEGRQQHRQAGDSQVVDERHDDMRGAQKEETGEEMRSEARQASEGHRMRLETDLRQTDTIDEEQVLGQKWKPQTQKETFNGADQSFDFRNRGRIESNQPMTVGQNSQNGARQVLDRSDGKTTQSFDQLPVNWQPNVRQRADVHEQWLQTNANDMEDSQVNNQWLFDNLRSGVDDMHQGARHVATGHTCPYAAMRQAEPAAAAQPSPHPARSPAVMSRMREFQESPEVWDVHSAESNDRSHVLFTPLQTEEDEREPETDRARHASLLDLKEKKLQLLLLKTRLLKAAKAKLKSKFLPEYVPYVYPYSPPYHHDSSYGSYGSYDADDYVGAEAPGDNEFADSLLFQPDGQGRDETADEDQQREASPTIGLLKYKKNKLSHRHQHHHQHIKHGKLHPYGRESQVNPDQEDGLFLSDPLTASQASGVTAGITDTISGVSTAAQRGISSSANGLNSAISDISSGADKSIVKPVSEGFGAVSDRFGGPALKQPTLSAQSQGGILPGGGRFLPNLFGGDTDAAMHDNRPNGFIQHIRKHHMPHFHMPHFGNLVEFNERGSENGLDDNRQGDFTESNARKQLVNFYGEQAKTAEDQHLGTFSSLWVHPQDQDKIAEQEASKFLRRYYAGDMVGDSSEEDQRHRTVDRQRQREAHRFVNGPMTTVPFQAAAGGLPFQSGVPTMTIDQFGRPIQTTLIPSNTGFSNPIGTNGAAFIRQSEGGRPENVNIEQRFGDSRNNQRVEAGCRDQNRGFPDSRVSSPTFFNRGRPLTNTPANSNTHNLPLGSGFVNTNVPFQAGFIPGRGGAFGDDLNRNTPLGANVASFPAQATFPIQNGGSRGLINSQIPVRNTGMTSGVGNFGQRPAGVINSPTNGGFMPGTIASIPNRVTNIPNRATNIPNRVSNIPNRVTNIPNRVTNIPNRVTNIPNRVTNIPNRVNNIPSRVTNIPKRVTNFNRGLLRESEDMTGGENHHTASQTAHSSSTNDGLSDITNTNNDANPERAGSSGDSEQTTDNDRKPNDKVDGRNSASTENERRNLEGDLRKGRDEESESGTKIFRERQGMTHGQIRKEMTMREQSLRGNMKDDASVVGDPQMITSFPMTSMVNTVPVQTTFPVGDGMSTVTIQSQVPIQNSMGGLGQIPLQTGSMTQQVVVPQQTLLTTPTMNAAITNLQGNLGMPRQAEQGSPGVDQPGNGEIAGVNGQAPGQVQGQDKDEMQNLEVINMNDVEMVQDSAEEVPVSMESSETFVPLTQDGTPELNMMVDLNNPPMEENGMPLPMEPADLPEMSPPEDPMMPTTGNIDNEAMLSSDVQNARTADESALIPAEERQSESSVVGHLARSTTELKTAHQLERVEDIGKIPPAVFPDAEGNRSQDPKSLKKLRDVMEMERFREGRDILIADKDVFPEAPEVFPEFTQGKLLRKFKVVSRTAEGPDDERMQRTSLNEASANVLEARRMQNSKPTTELGENEDSQNPNQSKPMSQATISEVGDTDAEQAMTLGETQDINLESDFHRINRSELRDILVADKTLFPKAPRVFPGFHKGKLLRPTIDGARASDNHDSIALSPQNTKTEDNIPVKPQGEDAPPTRAPRTVQQVQSKIPLNRNPDVGAYNPHISLTNTNTQRGSELSTQPLLSETDGEVLTQTQTSNRPHAAQSEFIDDTETDILRKPYLFDFPHQRESYVNSEFYRGSRSPKQFQTTMDCDDAATRSKRSAYYDAAAVYDVSEGEKSLHDSLNNLLRREEFLWVVNDLTEAMADDLNEAKDKPAVKREIRERAIALSRVFTDPKLKVDVSKTMDNLGIATRNVFEDENTPMYHLRNLLGSTKDILMSLMRIPPQNLVIPSNYKIQKLQDDDHVAKALNPNSDHLGAINLDFLSGLKEVSHEESEEAENVDEDGGNFVETSKIADTVSRLGSVIRESVTSGRDTLKHVGEMAQDAKNVIQTTKNVTPRIIESSPRARARSSESNRRKTVILSPRVLEIEPSSGYDRNPIESRPDFVQLGEVMDAVGVSKANPSNLGLHKVTLESVDKPVPIVRATLASLGGKSSKDPKTQRRHFQNHKETVGATIETLLAATQATRKKLEKLLDKFNGKHSKGNSATKGIPKVRMQTPRIDDRKRPEIVGQRHNDDRTGDKSKLFALRTFGKQLEDVTSKEMEDFVYELLRVNRNEDDRYGKQLYRNQDPRYEEQPEYEEAQSETGGRTKVPEAPFLGDGNAGPVLNDEYSNTILKEGDEIEEIAEEELRDDIPDNNEAVTVSRHERSRRSIGDFDLSGANHVKPKIPITTTDFVHRKDSGDDESQYHKSEPSNYNKPMGIVVGVIEDYISHLLGMDKHGDDKDAKQANDISQTLGISKESLLGTMNLMKSALSTYEYFSNAIPKDGILSNAIVKDTETNKEDSPYQGYEKIKVSRQEPYHSPFHVSSNEEDTLKKPESLIPNSYEKRDPKETKGELSQLVDEVKNFVYHAILNATTKKEITYSDVSSHFPSLVERFKSHASGEDNTVVKDKPTSTENSPYQDDEKMEFSRHARNLFPFHVLSNKEEILNEPESSTPNWLEKRDPKEVEAELSEVVDEVKNFVFNALKNATTKTAVTFSDYSGHFPALLKKIETHMSGQVKNDKSKVKKTYRRKRAVYDPDYSWEEINPYEKAFYDSNIIRKQRGRAHLVNEQNGTGPTEFENLIDDVRDFLADIIEDAKHRIDQGKHKRSVDAEMQLNDEPMPRLTSAELEHRHQKVGLEDDGLVVTEPFTNDGEVPEDDDLVVTNISSQEPSTSDAGVPQMVGMSFIRGDGILEPFMGHADEEEVDAYVKEVQSRHSEPELQQRHPEDLEGPELDHVLGAVNPFMFEELFNETLAVKNDESEDAEQAVQPNGWTEVRSDESVVGTGLLTGPIVKPFMGLASDDALEEMMDAYNDQEYDVNDVDDGKVTN